MGKTFRPELLIVSLPVLRYFHPDRAAALLAAEPDAAAYPIAVVGEPSRLVVLRSDDVEAEALAALAEHGPRRLPPLELNGGDPPLEPIEFVHLPQVAALAEELAAIEARVRLSAAGLSPADLGLADLRDAAQPSPSPSPSEDRSILDHFLATQAVTLPRLELRIGRPESPALCPACGAASLLPAEFVHFRCSACGHDGTKKEPT